VEEFVNRKSPFLYNRFALDQLAQPSVLAREAIGSVVPMIHAEPVYGRVHLEAVSLVVELRLLCFESRDLFCARTQLREHSHCFRELLLGVFVRALL